MGIHVATTKRATTALSGTMLVGLLLLGGCGEVLSTPGQPATVPLSSATPMTSNGPSMTPITVATSPTTGQTPTVPVATPISGGVRLSERSAGRTFQMLRGDRVVLTLHNTYWRIAPPDGRILTPTGRQTVNPPPAGTCRPGIGCGIVQASFIATATGSTAITASRTPCGEAMACPPGQGSFGAPPIGHCRGRA